MDKTALNFLSLFFNKGEEISVSCDKYGYGSITQEVLTSGTPFYLNSPNTELAPKEVTIEDIGLIAINPIVGFRRDSNVTACRSFLVEMDDGTLPEQKKYIEESGMPYSVCIYSGNKSLHFGIVLDIDLPMSFWKVIAQWIVNILPRADQQVKNPSRSIRFPGHQRKDGKGKVQKLLEINENRIEADVFFEWLNQHEDKKPKMAIKRPKKRLKYRRIPFGVTKQLNEGVDASRNSTWFSLACKMAESGYDIDYTLGHFDEYFEEELDFNKREWETCIKSAYKYMQGL